MIILPHLTFVTLLFYESKMKTKVKYMEHTKATHKNVDDDDNNNKRNIHSLVIICDICTGYARTFCDQNIVNGIIVFLYSSSSPNTNTNTFLSCIHNILQLFYIYLFLSHFRFTFLNEPKKYVNENETNIQDKTIRI